MPSPPAYLLLALVAAPALAQDRSAVPDGTALAQLTVQQRIMIRIPRLPVGRQPLASPPVSYVERKGPKCIAAQGLQAATITRPDAIDLLTATGERMRARLDDDCPPMDYYSGFYVKPGSDGMVCADRDAIRVRSGGTCPIEGFRRLVAKR